MALSPADFAAYSRATGTPYPEDPEERAELAPEVAEFRRNQLQQPKESSNLLETLGIAALGLGTLVGAGLAGRRMLRGGGQKQVSAAPGTQLTKIPEAAVQKIRQEGRPAPVAPSKVAAIPQSTVDLPTPPPKTVGRSIMPTTEEALQQYMTRLNQEIPEPTAAELNYPPTANRVYGVEYRERQGEPGYRSNVLASLDKKYPPSPAVQEARRAAATQDLLKAAIRIDATTPTLTDIQNTQIPINTNQFINAVESGEDQLTGRVMHGVQRNEDLDISKINELVDQTGNANAATSLTTDGTPVDQTIINQPYTAQELADLAKKEMITKRQSLEAAGFRPGTVRFERAFAQPFRTSQSQVITGTQPIEFALPAGSIKQTVESVGAQEPLIERSVVNIGPQAIVTSTAAGTAIRGASPSYHEALPKQQLRQIYGTADVLVPGAPDELALDLPGKSRVRGVLPDVEPQFLSKQEIQYGVLDRPETPGPAGGSAGIGVYGLEPGYVPGAVSKTTGEYSEAAERKPSYVPGWLQKQQGRTGFEALTTPQLFTAAKQAQGPRIQAAIEKEIGQRQTAKQSLEVSEALRRGRIEGRDPQMILRNLGFDV